MAASSDEMLQGMQERLKHLQAEKAAMLKEAQAVDGRVKEELAALGSKPRDTEADIDKKIKDKEHHRVTKSMPLSEEKKLLREIDLLKKQKVALKAYLAKDEELQVLKKKKSALYEALKGKDAAIAELGGAVKKLQLAQRCGVGVEDVVTITVEVPEGAVARVIGKGGANLKKIEETCKVTVDLDNGKKQGANTARISGSAAACVLAREKIEEVTQSIMEEAPVSEALAQTLILNKGAEINKLIAECNVRVDLARDEGLVKLSGLPANIAKARARLAILEQSMRRTALPLEKRLVPAVVGKGGSTIRRLEETYGVSVDVPRDGGEVVVSGFAEKVAGAVAELEELLATHADKEGAVPVDRFAARLLLAEDGKLLKELRKATGCLLYMDLKKEAEHGFVSLKGPAFKLEDAVAATKKVLDGFAAHTEVVEVGPEMVRYVIGKKGAVINKLREATGAAIETDADTGRVRVFSADPAVRAKAKAELQAVLDKNQASEVSVPREAAIALKGANGASLRDRAQKELEVQLDIVVGKEGSGEENASCVKLRGSAEAMAEVRAALLAFAEENYGSEMVLLGDAYLLLVSGGEESVRKQVEKAHGVALIPLRDDGLLKIRGPRVGVEAAEVAIRKALDGEDEADGTSAVVPCHPDAVPGLIGKGGAGAAKFREEHGCNLIVLKARDQIRVRGSDPAKVAGAAAALKKLLAEQRLTAVVPAKDWQMEALDLSDFRRQYDVTVEVKPKEGFRVRGLVAEVGAAKQRLSELVTKRGKATVELGAGQLARMPEGEWTKVREAYGVALDLDAPADRVLLQGGAEAVRKARAHVFTLLEAHFPGEYGHATVGSDAVPALPVLAQPLALAAFKARTGAEGVWLDREEGVVRVRGPAQAVAAAPAALDAFVQAWAATRAEVAFDGAWMLPILVGKGGSKVKELEKAHGVTVDIDRDGGVIRLSVPVPAEGEEVAAGAGLAAAKAALEKEVATVRSEYAEMRVPPEAVPALVGKGGQRIAKIREESGATIDVLSSAGSGGGSGGGGGGKGKGGRVREEAAEGAGNVRLRGAPAAIDKAKELIEAFVTEWIQSNVTQEVAVPHPEQFGLIVGRGGATVKAIQEESGGARLEMEREQGKVVVRGTAAAAAAAVAAVQKLLDDDLAENAARYAEAAAAREASQAREKKTMAAKAPAAPQNGHDALQDSSNSSGSVISSAGPPGLGQAPAAAGEWNFPTVPPGADAAMAKQLLERQEALASKGKRKNKSKAKKEQGTGAEAAAAAEPPTAAVAALSLAPAPVPAKERSSTPPMAPKAAAAPGDADGFVVVGKGSKGGKGGSKPAAAAGAAAPATTTEKKAQSALLDMVLGGASAPNGAPAPVAAVEQEPKPAAAAAPAGSGNGKYFKSASGFSIRL